MHISTPFYIQFKEFLDNLKLEGPRNPDCKLLTMFLNHFGFVIKQQLCFNIHFLMKCSTQLCQKPYQNQNTRDTTESCKTDRPCGQRVISRSLNAFIFLSSKENELFWYF